MKLSKFAVNAYLHYVPLCQKLFQESKYEYAKKAIPSHSIPPLLIPGGHMF